MGYKPKHPIVIVPGFVTSGLELWHGKPCANRFFRCAQPCSNAMMQGPGCAFWALLSDPPSHGVAVGCTNGGLNL